MIQKQWGRDDLKSTISLGPCPKGRLQIFLIETFELVDLGPKHPGL